MVPAVVVAVDVLSACVSMGHFVMVHVLMLHRVVLHAKLVLHARTAHWTQHGRRHRTPKGKQHSKQQQEPDANSFHYGQISTRGITSVQGCGFSL